MYFTSTTDAAPTTTPVQLRVVGTFTKALGTTRVAIIWNSHVTGTAAGGFCNFHVRVDGNASPASDLGAVIQSDAAYHPASTTNIFTGLAAGTHTITLWDRGVGATSCTDNPGNYSRLVTILEF